MDNSFDIKHQNHLKLYVLLKDSISFEDEMRRNEILFYSEIDEQSNTGEGIRYFLLDTDREKVDKLLVGNGIIASTETVSNYDFREQRKFYKVYGLATVIIVLLVALGFILEFVMKN